MKQRSSTDILREVSVRHSSADVCSIGSEERRCRAQTAFTRSKRTDEVLDAMAGSADQREKRAFFQVGVSVDRYGEQETVALSLEDDMAALTSGFNKAEFLERFHSVLSTDCR